NINFALGYSHPIVYQLPPGVTAKVERQVLITLESADRQLLGTVAAQIRELRPPEPYKGKGIKYSDEVIRRKAGKAAAGASAS
ncbi:MAG TPA: 50S ribosomal protein L6, partial [Candidatus Binataceae bacterium]|nr:50S ribosomal protein L6 [Candidatus Binataceae bacterium]